MDDATFVKAVTAAVIDEELAAEPNVPAKQSFSRAHVEQLRAAGCTREDARSYFESVFGAQQVRVPAQRDRGAAVSGGLRSAVDALMSDLDGYGPWEA